MRVNVQLIDAETGNHPLGRGRFDKPLADLTSTCRTKSSRGWRARSTPSLSPPRSATR